MNRAFLSVLLLAIAATLTGCASPYLVDRGRDAADIFTVQLGAGVGAKARIGPIQTGLIFDVPLCYMRGGKVGTNRDGCNSCYQILPPNTDLQLICIGGEDFQFHSDPVMTQRRKGYGATNLGGEGVVPFFHRTDRSCPSYYTQIEVAGGYFVTGRLGFNPGELLDFILGWTTIDIYKDDLERLKQKQNLPADD